jgi:ABC-type spermidine/putrescine transport system permease subunit I
MATAVASAGAPAARRGAGRILEAGAGLALVAAPLLVLLLLVLIPAGLAIGSTLLIGEPDGPSLARYAAFFTDPFSTGNLRYTLALTAFSTIAAIALALGIALYLRFSTHPIAGLIHGLSLIPLFVPSIIISYALIRFLGPNGTLQLLLESVGIGGFRSPYLTPLGPFLAFVWENIPLPVLVLSAGLAQLSDNAIDAARDLGAGRLRIFVEIVLPQIARSLAIAFSLTVLGIIGSYTIPYLLGPPAPEMMGPFMQRTFGDLQDPEAAEVQAVIVMLCASVVGLIYLAAMRREDDAR